MWVVVVAQLVERSLLTQEICCSIAVIGNFINYHLYEINRVEKTKIKKKRPRIAQFLF